LRFLNHQKSAPSFFSIFGLRFAFISRDMCERKTSVLLAAMFAFSLQSIRAIELGDSRSDVETRHGTPVAGDRPHGKAVYEWDLWKIEIQYTDDVVHGLTFTKTDPMSDAEIQKILDQNGGLVHWRAAYSTKDQIMTWLRSDGANAMRDVRNNRVISLHGGRMPPQTLPVKQSPPIQQTVNTALSKIVGIPAKIYSANPSTETVPSATILPAAPPSTPALTLPSAPSVMMFVVAAALGILGGSRVLFDHRKKSKKNTVPSPIPASPRKFDNSIVEAIPDPPIPTIESTSWQDFELLIGEVYRRKGYQVEISSGFGADAGIDLHLRRNGNVVLVQCKHWKAYKVSVKEIREFYGVIKAENANRGIFVNTGVYTRDALSFAQGKEIELLDGDDVDTMIQAVSRPHENLCDSSQWLDDFIAAAVITEPLCPRCDAPMILRSSKNGPQFWGCYTFPSCRGKRDARTELLRDMAYRPR
jgi:restriction system protein